MLWQLLLALTNEECRQAAYTCLATAHELQMITYTRLSSAASQAANEPVPN